MKLLLLLLSLLSLHRLPRRRIPVKVDLWYDTSTWGE